MSKSFGDGWESREIPVSDLWLDDQNPRLDLRTGSSQELVRKALINHEDVLELAVQIANRQGMLAGERLIVTQEAGRFVVLEGNRRAAAAQILCNPALLPKTLQKRLPSIPSALRDRLLRIPADIAPDRISAEPILTKRHTERGVRPWSTLANMRRVYRYFEAGRSVEEVCQVLSITKARATQLIRGYKLFELAKASKEWSQPEQEQLSNPKLVTSGFTRFFTLKDTRVRLGLGFDDKQSPTTSLSKKDFQSTVQKIAKGFLLPEQDSGKPMFDTRSSVANVLDGVPTAKSATQPHSSSARAAAVKAPQASEFFENLQCLVRDDHLLKLAGELKDIDYKKRPAAACMLLRALFECALVYQLKKKNLWQGLIATKKGKDPSLDVLMTYCANDQHSVFAERRICTLLSNDSAIKAKEYLDLVTHGRWAEADPAHIKSVAIRLRKVIAAILDNSQ